MKVYLSCPIVGRRRLRVARALYDVVSEAGHDVVSKWLVEKDPGFSLSPPEVYDRDTQGVQISDLVLADVSNPSHGVGMEIMLALTLNKPVIAVAPKRVRLSRMLLGAPNLVWLRYSDLKSLRVQAKQALLAFCK